MITGMKGRSSKRCTKLVESSSLNMMKSKQWTRGRSSQHKKFVHLMKVRTTVDVPLGVVEGSLKKLQTEMAFQMKKF